MNVVIIGGALDAQSPDELDVLSSIEDLVQGQPGVMLLGNLPHADVARLLRAAAESARPAYRQVASTSARRARRSSA